jgi:pimeloyl-ACP methyl ester carboxylesterase
LVTDMNQRAASQYIRAFRDTANNDLIREKGLTGLLLETIKWDKPSNMEPEERAALLKDWEDRDACFAMVNWYRASALYVPAMDEKAEIPPFASGDFPKLNIPTLVIWAMDDLALPPSNVDGIEKWVPNVKIEPIENCGHFVIWEKPAEVNLAMQMFLAE